uniref:Protein kinase domain-containing protein n=1 Tax=Vannella robusta TaxID=1487602 RepID=A0A7S4HTZ8_9EUKA|mmetsp:Transcript_15579/g.19841  ORF Transcript_15579/g.19841 Transcript_15579/m.19841 type:complete len:450 (+) Transcript_15579:105-1454(+)
MATELSLVWPQVQSNYELYEIIKETEQHRIYRGICNFDADLDTGKAPHPREVAIKVIDADMLTIEQIETIRKEVISTRSNYHPNVVKYYTSFVCEENIWIVMELLHYCSIRQIMEELSPGGLTEPLVVYILYHVLVGLEYLHKQERAHRNLKGSHILVNKRGNIKLGDFAVSTSLVACGERNTATTLVGTLAWMAPEVLETNRKYTCMADIWSLGMVALELATGKNPFEGFPPMKIVKTLCGTGPESGRTPAAPPSFSKYFAEFVSACLQIDPNKRLSANKLLDMKVFRSMKKKEVFVQFLDSSKRKLRSMSFVHTEGTMTEKDALTNQASDDEYTETWTFNEEEQSGSIPLIQVLVGETPKAYAIVVRTIAQANVSFKLRAQELVVIGKIPPPPTVPGVTEWKTETGIPIPAKSTSFSKTVHFDSEIDTANISKKKQGTTFFVSIGKV